MAYEQDKDVLVEVVGPVADTEMIGEIRQYDGGDKKLAIYRVYGKNKDKRTQVLRLPLDTITVLGEYLVEFTSKYGTGEDVSEDDANSDTQET